MVFLEKDKLGEGDADALEVLYALWGTFFGGTRGDSYLLESSDVDFHIIGQESGEWLSYAQVRLDGGRAELRFIWHPTLGGSPELLSFLGFLLAHHEFQAIKWVLYPDLLLFLQGNLEKEGFRLNGKNQTFEFTAPKKMVREREGWVFSGKVEENLFCVKASFLEKPSVKISINTKPSSHSFDWEVLWELNPENKIYVLSKAISLTREEGFLNTLTYEVIKGREDFLSSEELIKMGFREIEATEIWEKEKTDQ